MRTNYNLLPNEEDDPATLERIDIAVERAKAEYREKVAKTKKAEMELSCLTQTDHTNKPLYSTNPL
jgi:hypothetical protein